MSAFRLVLLVTLMAVLPIRGVTAVVVRRFRASDAALNVVVILLTALATTFCLRLMCGSMGSGTLCPVLLVSRLPMTPVMRPRPLFAVFDRLISVSRVLVDLMSRGFVLNLPRLITYGMASRLLGLAVAAGSEKDCGEKQNKMRQVHGRPPK